MITPGIHPDYMDMHAFNICTGSWFLLSRRENYVISSCARDTEGVMLLGVGKDRRRPAVLRLVLSNSGTYGYQ